MPSSVRFEQIPDAPIESAKAFILDSFGVGIAGSATPESKRLGELADSWGSDGQAGVWGTRFVCPAPTAALVVSNQLHCLEFDCIHEPAVVHPLTVLLPAVTAVMQREGKRTQFSGRDLIAAVVVGVDIAGGLGDVTTSSLQFFRPGTAGIFGAIAAIGNAKRLNSEVIADAMGVGYGQVSGTMQPHVEGSDLLPLQVGFNARNAVVAVDLAIVGQSGPREIFEGPFGYFRLIEASGTPSDLVATLGHVWEITRVSYKPYPAGRATHGGIDGALQLRDRLGIDVSSIEEVVARVPPMIHQLVDRPLDPAQTASAARLNLRFQIASALHDGFVDLTTTRPERLSDPRIHRLASHVRIEIDENPDSNAFNPQTLEIRTSSGTTESTLLPNSLGSPSNPLPKDRQLEKFKSCIRYGAPHWPVSRTSKLLRLLDELEDVENLTEIWELL